MKALGEAAITVLGNHDLYLLMVAEGVENVVAKDDTLDDILAATDCDELLAWLRHQKLCHIENGYCLVHAGLLPQWTVAEARALAAEVEALLQGPPIGMSSPICGAASPRHGTRICRAGIGCGSSSTP